MNKREIKRRYKELVAGIESAPMFDGRGKGVDVYVCDECGASFYTRYKEKGCTPFTIRCRKCEGTSVHKVTIPDNMAEAMGVKAHNWVRPTIDQLLKLNEGAIEHVLNGGLILEDEIERKNYELKQK